MLLKTNKHLFSFICDEFWHFNAHKPHKAALKKMENLSFTAISEDLVIPCDYVFLFAPLLLVWVTVCLYFQLSESSQKNRETQTLLNRWARVDPRWALTQPHCKRRRLPFQRKMPPSVSEMTAGIKAQPVVGHPGRISWVHCGPKIVGFVETNDFLEAFIFQRAHALMQKKGHWVINESGKGLAHFE